jgi:hypothetical protein
MHNKLRIVGLFIKKQSLCIFFTYLTMDNSTISNVDALTKVASPAAI